MVKRQFVGRRSELAVLKRELQEVEREAAGRFVLVRGRRRVGKSRLVTEFLRQTGVPAVYHTGTRQPPGRELTLFTEAIERSGLDAGALVSSGAAFGTWEAAFRAIASSASRRGPVAVVLDELPYISATDPSFEAQLQAIWDRVVEPAPMLLIIIGSDLAVMEALTSYDRPLYGRPTMQLVIEPLHAGEVGRLLNLDGADAVDAALIVGGFPLIALSWSPGTTMEGFITDAVSDPTSALVSSAERTLAGEFPDVETSAVLLAVGAGEVAFSRIATRTQIPQTTLRRILDVLVAKRVLALEYPLSARSTRRLAHYTVIDAYLRFWLRFIGPGLSDIERGRADLVIARILRDWPTYRGRAVEPLVRRAMERQLPRPDLGAARTVGAYWDRSGTTEVDLVGAEAIDAARVDFVGSIKWRATRPFDNTDLAVLVRHRDAVPGTDDDTVLVAVTRTGATIPGVDVTFGPDLLLDPA
jgi:AAA+ ATPase superfamily predicted ATPase